MNDLSTIKEYLDEDAEMAVDIKNSLVMVEGVDSASAVSLYRFIKLLRYQRRYFYLWN